MRQTPAVSLAALLLLAGCSGDGSDADDSEDAEPPGSATTWCRGSLGAETVEGDLVVPRERTCRLDGTVVRGRVTVSYGAALIARKARLDEGVGAHDFERVELHDVSSEGAAQVTDFVLDSGRDVVVRGGPINGRYWIVGNTGRVEIRGLDLDLGRVYCADNTRKPDVRNVSAETPAVLQGQCAGLKNFGVSDF